MSSVFDPCPDMHVCWPLGSMYHVLVCRSNLFIKGLGL